MLSVKFIVGAAIGYVAGTAAGRERFNQLKTQLNKLTGTETVQQLQSDLSTAKERAAQAVAGKVQEGSAKISGRDSGSSSESSESSSDAGSSDPSLTGAGAPPLGSSGTLGTPLPPPSTSDLTVDEPLIPDAGTSYGDDPLAGDSPLSELDPDPLASDPTTDPKRDLP